MKQLITKTGEDLRDTGMQKAIDHADLVVEQWSQRAYRFLLEYIRTNKGFEFMTEDLRYASYGYIEEPPSKRAWGGIVLRAAKAGLIKRVGYQRVINPKAHCTPATVWITT